MHQPWRYRWIVFCLAAIIVFIPAGSAIGKPKAEKAAKQREAFKKRLLKELGKREDGCLLLALEESDERPVAVTIKVAEGRDAAIEAIVDFVGGATQTNRTFQLLGWFDDNADGKRLADNHRASLERSIANRFKAPRFTLDPCYSDLGGAGQSLADRLGNGTAIRYLPFR